MEDAALFAQSSQVKRDADALLEASQLIPFLGSYGTVQMAGSYSFNLMINRDIDIYVINPEHTQDATLEAMNASIRRNYFHSHQYCNTFLFPSEGKPAGYYLGIKTVFRAYKWKIDTWFLHEDLPARSRLIQAVQQASEAEKAAILRLKQLVRESGSGVRSIHIYEAVLQNHITSEQDFLTFLAQRSLPGEVDK